MSKKCINCGAELSAEASFCPYCATNQTEKQVIKTPRLWRKKAIMALMAVLIVMAVCWGIKAYHAPEIYEGGEEIIYTVEDKVYHVLVSFAATDGVMRSGDPEVTVELPPGSEGAFPDQLYIYQEGTDAHVWEEFMSLVESCTVEAVPLDGAQAMQVGVPSYNEDFPYAAQMTNVIYDTSCGANEIRWTLHMKNGDEIRLKQTIHTIEKDVICYYPEQVPMDTAVDLQTLLDQIAQRDDGTAVEIYLPPVIYDQEIHVGKGGYTFYGGSNGEVHTTFTKTVTVETENYQFVKVFGVRFEGEGGTGILARDAVLLIDCWLQGWDVAAVAKHGGWICALNSTFENNGIGLHMDTLESMSSRFDYRSNRFVGNDTALLISQLYGTIALTFEETVFAENGKDVDNPAGYPVDLSGALFE